jgi:Flp pilus assembly protein CpaB
MSSVIQVRTWWRVNRWLLLGALLVGVAVYASLRFLSSETRLVTRTAPTAVVYVLRQALPADTVITAADVGTESLPLTAVPPGALTVLPVGLWTSEALPADVPLVAQDVFAPATSEAVSVHIPPGDVAMNLSLPPTNAVDGILAPNDRVSILATVPTTARGKPETEWFLRHVLVLAVNGALNGQPTPGAGESLILAVTPEQALAIQFAETAGSLTVVLERPGEALTAPPAYGPTWPSPPPSTP